jgi:2'-5' RNA ligase
MPASGSRGRAARRAGQAPSPCRSLDPSTPPAPWAGRSGRPSASFAVNSYEPLIDDAVVAGELDGQRFVVLRVPADVARRFDTLKQTVRTRLSGLPVSYPARAHVTLCRFAAGADLGTVQDLARTWAAGTPPLSIDAERPGTFPPPFQVVFVGVRKTPELFTALASLRRAAEERGIAQATAIPPEDWIFHLSLAYCASLSAQAWARVTRVVGALPAADARGVVHEAEVVAFDEGREHSGGVFPLSAAGSWSSPAISE